MLQIKNIVFAALLITAMNASAQSTVKLYVSDKRDYCPGIGDPQKCLLIRESPELEWTYYPYTIKGFHYSEGYAYQLLVRTNKIKNPYDDPTAVEYTLVRTLKKEKISDTTEVKQPALASVKQPAPKQTIFGNWRLTELNDRPISDSARISLRFAGQNRYGGDSGCNHYGGSYTPNNDSIHFSMGPMTRMACYPNEIMKLESEYLQTLRKAAAFKKETASLVILDINGKIIAKFLPALK